MATYTLQDVLQDVGATVDQDVSVPTGSELQTRARFVNRSQDDWANAYNWDALKLKFAPTVLLSMTSIGLPSNFREFTGPVYDASNYAFLTYPQIKPDQKQQKSVTDRYVIVRGNKIDGMYLEVNPGLASGVSLVADYISFPSSLITLSDVAVCPNREYLSKRTTYYVLEARSDSRFPLVKSDTENLLRQLVEEQDSPSGAENNRVPDWTQRTGFAIGED